MARLIDAEPLCKTPDDLSNENMGIGLPQMASGINTAICQINAALTVDAVEVVRCAQCKWWTPKDGTWKSFGDCSEMAERYTEDCESDMDCQTGYNDFCSCGERKE